MTYVICIVYRRKFLLQNLILIGLLASFVFSFSIVSAMAGSIDNIEASATMEILESETEDVATFAGGCFWCSEANFEAVEGVVEAVSGYTGGYVKNPTYQIVCSGSSGHYEAVQVFYDPEIISYSELMDIYWGHINPTDTFGQFADRGSQYRTAIFYHNEEQKIIAEESKKQLEESGKFDEPIATQILPLTVFYPAEDYHQDYYKKQSERYSTYQRLSGREQYIEETWGIPEPSLIIPEDLTESVYREYAIPEFSPIILLTLFLGFSLFAIIFKKKYFKSEP
ncbi:MAG: peptide-methionine (S)-S-oxide reductase MsrA [Candidatus Bathyarchaeota archaeon]